MRSKTICFVCLEWIGKRPRCHWAAFFYWIGLERFIQSCWDRNWRADGSSRDMGISLFIWALIVSLSFICCDSVVHSEMLDNRLLRVGFLGIGLLELPCIMWSAITYIVLGVEI